MLGQTTNGQRSRVTAAGTAGVPSQVQADFTVTEVGKRKSGYVTNMVAKTQYGHKMKGTVHWVSDGEKINGMNICKQNADNVVRI